MKTRNVICKQIISYLTAAVFIIGITVTSCVQPDSSGSNDKKPGGDKPKSTPAYTFAVGMSNDGEKEAGGSISSEETTKQGTYNKGTNITVKALEKQGYWLLGWYDTSTDAIAGKPISTDNPYTFSLTKNSELYAWFKKIPANTVYFKIGKTSGSTGECSINRDSATLDGWYSKNTPVTAQVTTGNNTRFIGWYDSTTDGSLISEENPYIFNLTDNTTIYAGYAQIPGDGNNVSYFRSEITGGAQFGFINKTIGTPDGFYRNGTELEVIAELKDGQNGYFKGWYDRAGNQLSSDTCYIFTITGDLSLSAKFEEIPANSVYFKLSRTPTLDSTGSGTVSANKEDGYYSLASGPQTVHLTATPNSNTSFLGWFTDQAGTTPAQILTEPDEYKLEGNINYYYAKFRKKEYTVKIVPPAPLGRITYLSMATDNNGKINIVYYKDNELGGDPKNIIWVTRNPLSLTQSHYEIEHILPIVADKTNLVGAVSNVVVDSNGNPHICYYDQSEKKLIYSYREARGKWSRIYIGEGSPNLTHYTSTISLDLDNNDNPGICFRYPDGSFYSEIKYAYSIDRGLTWVTDANQIDKLDRYDLAKYNSFAFDNNNNPKLVYTTGMMEDGSSELRYASRDAATGIWTYTTLEKTQTQHGLAGQISGNTSLVFDSQNRPHIIYSHNTGSSSLLQYRTIKNSEWFTEVVWNDSRGPSVLALNRSDRPLISNYGSINNVSAMSVIAQNEAGRWESTPFDYRFQSTLNNSTAAIDKAGNLIMCYFAQNYQELRIAEYK